MQSVVKLIIARWFHLFAIYIEGKRSNICTCYSMNNGLISDKNQEEDHSARLPDDAKLQLKQPNLPQIFFAV